MHGISTRRDDPDFLRLVDMNEEFMRFAGAGNPVDIMPWTRWLTQRSVKQKKIRHNAELPPADLGTIFF